MINTLKYNSGFDLIDMMNEFDGEYVKFMGSTENGTYLVSIDDVDGMLYMKVPVDDYDGIVRKESFYRDGLATWKIIRHRVVNPSNSRELLLGVTLSIDFWIMSFRLKVHNLTWKDSFTGRILLILTTDL